MKQLVRRVPAHTVRSFQCEVCGTKYSTKNQALTCEARIKEEQVFKEGDLAHGRLSSAAACAHTKAETSLKS